MARLPAARVGRRVEVKGRPLAFSYWPMYRTTRRYGLQAHVYATSPWALMETSIKTRRPAQQLEAIAFLNQGHYFCLLAVLSG